MTKVFASFYRASDKPNGSPDVHEMLLTLAENPNLAARERLVSKDILIRLERLENDGDFIAGEFCRKQTDNIPPSAGPQGLNEINLGEGNGLGYLAAFRYHLPSRIILLERNKMSASHMRLAMYLKKLNPAATFLFSEILRQDAWERFRRGTIRHFKISLATPQNLEALEAEGLPAAGSIKQLADIFDGITVNFEVGVGHSRDAHLNKNMVQRAIEKFNGNADVRSIKSAVADEDGTSWLDFTDDCLVASEKIEHAGFDIAAKYHARAGFLSRAFDDKLAYLEEL